MKYNDQNNNDLVRNLYFNFYTCPETYTGILYVSYFQNLEYAALKSSNSDNYYGDFKIQQNSVLVCLK